ncbi:MAG: hypothetical protein V8S92_04445 [Oscillospiraceae bacterium]
MTDAKKIHAKRVMAKATGKSRYQTRRRKARSGISNQTNRKMI